MKQGCYLGTRQDATAWRRRFVRSIGTLCLLLWGLALPRPVAVSAAKSVTATGTVQRPVLRLERPTDYSPAQLDLLERRHQAEQRLVERLGPHGISAKGLARRRQWMNKISAQGFAAAAQLVDTLQVLLVRIDFETDRSGTLTAVTEDGGFLCDPDPENYPIDPPPHDDKYFSAHMEGLAEYWKSMSNGRLHVEPTILPPPGSGPRAPCDGYTLSDIADYGPGRGGFWNLDGLVRLVQDMIVVTDEGTQADGSVNLADFDFDNPNTFIIFAHSGSDFQSNLVFETSSSEHSPNDIPTFFVQLGDEDEVPLTSLDSITGQPGLVRECSVIPESTTQDGLVGAINAALYHEFGHALGLPDLYSTTTGLPAVGYWDLMGTGTNLATVLAFAVDEDPIIATGVLPPSLGIWGKWFLGWVDPIEIGSNWKNLSLPATYRQDRVDKAVLLSVGPDEFFLVENRYVAPFVPVDNRTGAVQWALISDQDTGVVLYMGQNIDDPRPPNVHMYDFFLPTGGLLVWRVRQDLIDGRIESNVVQGLPWDRALELIEADGLQDIGVFDFRTVGFLGWEDQPFRKGSIETRTFDNFQVEFPETATEMGPDTVPNTESSMRVPTGIEIRNIPSSAPDMPFQARVQPSLIEPPVTPGVSGYPVTLPVVDNGGGPVPYRGRADSPAYIESGGEDAVLVVAAPADGSGLSAVFAYQSDGRPTFGGDGSVFTLSAEVAGPIAVVDDLGGQPAVLVAAVDGTVEARRVDLSGTELPLVSGYPASFGGAITDGPTIVETATSTLILGSERGGANGGRIAILEENGAYRPDWTDTYPFASNRPLRSLPVGLDTDGDRRSDAIAFVAGGEVFAYTIGSSEQLVFQLGSPDGPPLEDNASVWLTALPANTNGQPDRLLVLASQVFENTPETRMWTVSFDGAWSAQPFGDPLPLPAVGEPAVADFDGDGELDVLVCDHRLVFAFRENGVQMTGFPLLLSDEYLISQDEDVIDGPWSTPLIADVDGDGLNELCLVSFFGVLHSFERDGDFTPGYPRKASGGGALAPLIVDHGPAGRRSLVLYEALGDTVTVGAAVRSARLQRLELPVATAAVRPAEWLGRAGGLARTGRAKVGGVAVAAIDSRELQPLIYPNPATGDLVRVRFRAGADHEAQVTLFNLEGQQIKQIAGDAAADQTTEVSVPIDDMVPGGYVCRLNYVGPQGQATQMLTFYIER